MHSLEEICQLFEQAVAGHDAINRAYLQIADRIIEQTYGSPQQCEIELLNIDRQRQAANKAFASC